MTPETYIPDPSRFVNHDNEVISILMMAVIGLIIYNVWKDVMTFRERKEVNKSLKDNTEVMNKIYGALDD